MSKFIKCILATFLIVTCGSFNNHVFADEYIVNITVIGNLKVGKTSLISQLVDGKCIEGYVTTNWSGDSAEGREVQKIIGTDIFKFRFWDAPGYQEGAEDVKDKVSRLALKRSNIIIIMNDLSSEIVQSNAPNTIAETFQYYGYAINSCSKSCEIIVVGSHADKASKEKVVGFKSSVDTLFSMMGYKPIPCFTVAAVNKDDPGCKAVLKYLNESVVALGIGSLEKRELSGIVVTCCVCGKSYDKSECVPNPREGGFYCPEHKIEAFRKKCPGSCPGNVHDFYDVERTVRKPDGTEEKCHDYVIVSDGKGRETKYCTQACMENALRSPCPRKGCAGFLRCRFEEKGPNRFEKKGLVGSRGADGKFYCSADCRDLANRQPCARVGCKRFVTDDDKVVSQTSSKEYCSSECLRDSEGTLCLSCRSFKFLPGEETKVGDKEFCSHCAKNLVYCALPGALHLVDGDPVIGTIGRKYCSRDHMREAEGIECPHCKEKFLHDDDGVVKEGDTEYCCRDCALEEVGVRCARGSKCTKSSYRRYLPSEMLRGDHEKTEDKLFCCPQCWKDGHSFRAIHFSH